MTDKELAREIAAVRPGCTIVAHYVYMNGSFVTVERGVVSLFSLDYEDAPTEYVSPAHDAATGSASEKLRWDLGLRRRCDFDAGFERKTRDSYALAAQQFGRHDLTYDIDVESVFQMFGKAPTFAGLCWAWYCQSACDLQAVAAAYIANPDSEAPHKGSARFNGKFHSAAIDFALFVQLTAYPRTT